MPVPEPLYSMLKALHPDDRDALHEYLDGTEDAITELIEALNNVPQDRPINFLALRGVRRRYAHVDPEDPDAIEDLTDYTGYTRSYDPVSDSYFYI